MVLVLVTDITNAEQEAIHYISQLLIHSPRKCSQSQRSGLRVL